MTPVDLSQEEHKTTATCFTCKHCNNKGHLAKDCPNVRGEYQEYLQMKNTKNTKDKHVEEVEADVPGEERENCQKEQNIEKLENNSSVDFLLIDNSDEEEVESSCLENVQVTRINGEETKNGHDKEDDRITNNSEDNEPSDVGNVIRTTQKRQRYINEFYIYI